MNIRIIETENNIIGCTNKTGSVIAYTPIYRIDGRPYTKLRKTTKGKYKWESKICTKGYVVKEELQ